jgi:hypothetical protein
MLGMLTPEFVIAVCNDRPNSLLTVYDFLNCPFVLNIDLLPNVNTHRRVDRIGLFADSQRRPVIVRDPPATVFFYSRNRGNEHPAAASRQLFRDPPGRRRRQSSSRAERRPIGRVR